MITAKELEKRIRLQAGDLIYCWLYNNDAPDLGANANRLFKKRDLQVKYLKALAYGTPGVTEEDIQRWILDELKNTYQPIRNPKTGIFEAATPRLIMAALMRGESVKGKNWTQGMYGCKVGDIANTISVPKEVVLSGAAPTYTLDSNLGIVETSSEYLSAPTYDLKVSDTQPTCISTITENATNSWSYNHIQDNYYLSAISNGENTITPEGKKLTFADQELWDNINNAFSQIQTLISGFAEFLSNITAAEALTPVQVADGWVQPSNSGNSSSNSGLILGSAALLTGAVLLTDNKSRKKK